MHCTLIPGSLMVLSRERGSLAKDSDPAVGADGGRTSQVAIRFQINETGLVLHDGLVYGLLGISREGQAGDSATNFAHKLSTRQVPLVRTVGVAQQNILAIGADADRAEYVIVDVLLRILLRRILGLRTSKRMDTARNAQHTGRDAKSVAHASLPVGTPNTNQPRRFGAAPLVCQTLCDKRRVLLYHEWMCGVSHAEIPRDSLDRHFEYGAPGGITRRCAPCPSGRPKGRSPPLRGGVEPFFMSWVRPQ